jgi:hypothetical protein
MTRQKIKFASVEVRPAESRRKLPPQFSKEVRAIASSKELMTISDKAQTGTTSKLSMIDYSKIGVDSKDDSLFQNNLEIETFIEKFEIHCGTFEMIELFNEFPVLQEPLDEHLDGADRFREGKTINLLDKWDRIGDDKDISLRDIADTIHWIKKFATSDSEAYLQDLSWTHNYLLRSMDTELSEAVTSCLKHDFTLEEGGGPLTFAIMIDKCINLSEEAIEALKTSITSYDIKNVKGENVSTVCRRFLYALKRLKSNNAITPSLLKSLFKVFQTTSVPDFNAFVAHWSRDLTRRNAVRPDFREILTEVENLYKNLLASGEWTGVNQKGNDSAFQAEEKPAFIPGQEQKSQSGPPQNEPSPYRPPEPADLIPGSNPPRYQRIVRGKTLKYCSKCSTTSRWGKTRKGRWNGTHFTDEHKGEAKVFDSNDKKPQANKAEVETTTKSLSFAEALGDAQSDEK